jgi:hypothetical protein
MLLTAALLDEIRPASLPPRAATRAASFVSSRRSIFPEKDEIAAHGRFIRPTEATRRRGTRILYIRRPLSLLRREADDRLFGSAVSRLDEAMTSRW